MVDRSVRIAAAFAARAAAAPVKLCAVCVDTLAVTGAGITLMSGSHAGPICVSSPSVSALEDLQFTLGEGPCQDAFASGAPVSAPRLTAVTGRWPTFAAEAVRSGIGAVFAYPMQAEVSSIGVLTLYQDREGELTAEQKLDSLEVAAVLTEAVLALQGKSEALAPELDESVAHRAEVHQATGMVSVQLDVSPSEALTRIRAYAYAENQPINEVASAIVQRRLRLHTDTGGGNR